MDPHRRMARHAVWVSLLLVIWGFHGNAAQDPPASPVPFYLQERTP